MNKDDTDVDEDDVQRKHDEAYNKGNASNMSSGAIGRWVTALLERSERASSATKIRSGAQLIHL